MKDNVSFVMYHLRNLCIACNEVDAKNDFSPRGFRESSIAYSALKAAASMAKTCGMFCVLSRNPETKRFDAVGVYDSNTDEMCSCCIGDYCAESVITFCTCLHGTYGSVYWSYGYCRMWKYEERRFVFKVAYGGDNNE